ncbi:MAG: hypothetical protein AAF639_34295 [Chloroflexota bacterium]
MNSSVYAHGGGTPQLSNVEVGPYRLFVWTEPEPWVVGEVHLTLAATLPPPEGTTIDEGAVNNQLDTPATDVNFNIELRSKTDPSQRITLTAFDQGYLNDYYHETDTILPTAGEWIAMIEVDGPLGSGRTGFITNVDAQKTYNWQLIGGASVGLLVVLILLVLQAQQGRKGRKIS